MITEFEAQNYGPIKSVKAALTPLHAFIGPNDSGKSTVLQGLVTAINCLRGWKPMFPAASGSLRLTNDDASLLIRLPDFDYESRTGNAPSSWLDGLRQLGMAQGARLARFEADALRQPSALIPEDEAFEFITLRGLGLPGIYDILNNRNDNGFDLISEQLKRLFPTVARLRLRTVTASSKILAVELRNGTVVDAASMSEGMLYFLAYAAIRRLSGISLIAVEEPETGLHPSRIAEVMTILREISAEVQVVIATHSPLVVNELTPEEISVVTRTAEEGTKVQRIIDTPNFQKRSKVYALGELWVSYANGLDEAPLLKGDVP